MATTWLPVLVTLASQNDEIVEPVGRSNSTRQVSGDVEPLTIVYLPSYPLPQSDDLVNVAEAPLAAKARVTGTTAKPTASNGGTDQHVTDRSSHTLSLTNN